MMLVLCNVTMAVMDVWMLIWSYVVAQLALGLYLNRLRGQLIFLINITYVTYSDFLLIDQTNHLPRTQTDSASLHCPLAKHDMYRDPLGRNPVGQAISARAPNDVPFGDKIFAFSKMSGNSSHSIAV